MFSFVILSVSIFFFAIACYGQELGTLREKIVLLPGSDVALAYGTIQCYDYDKYFVITAEPPASPGSNILVKRKADYDGSIACSYIVEDKDFEVKNEWAEYFFGIYEDLLFVDSGTCPCPRLLIIYDISKKKEVYETSYSETIEIDGSKLSFWFETEEANRENCPNYDEISHGISAAIETLVILDLKDFTLHKTDKTRCEHRM
ncbi:MAG: hypothetical protein HY805_04530 [Nitrospirae bacterium]|nr:hypothetical protein [Nitrospirota bacterium]